VAFGEHLSALRVSHRLFQVEMEGGTEERVRASLCQDTVEAELALDLDRRVYSIALRSPGQCLNGVCVGDTFTVASRQPGIIPFIAEEEGGVLFLRSEDRTITYDVATGDLPIDCYRSLDACSAALRDKGVNAIVLNREPE
jgi:hypothetical protein